MSMSLMTDLHGMAVHFPIALLFASVALELAALHPKLRAMAQPAALFTLILGTLGAAAAVFTGPEDNARGVTKLMGTHENMAHITLIIFGVLTVWRLYLLWRNQTLSRALLAGYIGLALIGLGALGYTGWLGGRMVYTEAVGVQRNGVMVAPPQQGHYRH